jgi:hypothetical protein
MIFGVGVGKVFALNVSRIIFGVGVGKVLALDVSCSNVEKYIKINYIYK